MRNILVILALFVCTSICLEGATVNISSETKVDYREDAGETCYYSISGNSTDRDGILNNDNTQLNDPTGNTVIVHNLSQVGNVFGACMNKFNLENSRNRPSFLSMTNNTVIVDGSGESDMRSDFHGGDIAGTWAADSIADLENVVMYVSSNSVIIMGGDNIGNVYGGCAAKGTVSSNTVTITSGTTVTSFVNGGWVNNGDAIDNRVTLISGTVRQSIFGGYVGGNGNAMYNTVTINDGKIEGEVLGGCIIEKGTATLNEVHLTSVTVRLVVMFLERGLEEMD